MYYIVYKTVNLINGHYYIGYHKQKNLSFDGYLGSGVLLNKAIKKYGRENFKRETLYIFKTKEYAVLKEKELVDLSLILCDLCYNIRCGGEGGDTRIGKSQDELQSISQKSLNTKIKNGKLKDTDQIKLKKKIAAEKRIGLHPHTLPNNKNRKHSGIALENLRNGYKDRIGKFVWITNGIIDSLINKNEILPEGFKYGKKFTGPTSHTTETKLKISNNPKIKGVICYTDGIKNLKLQPNEIPPEGFWRGMTQKKKVKTDVA